jgi:hypothetical protein
MINLVNPLKTRTCALCEYRGEERDFIEAWTAGGGAPALQAFAVAR